MYICICHSVTEQQIKEAIQQGAHNLRMLKETLNVCSQCKKCYPEVRQLLRTHRKPLSSTDDEG